MQERAERGKIFQRISKKTRNFCEDGDVEKHSPSEAKINTSPFSATCVIQTAISGVSLLAYFQGASSAEMEEAMVPTLRYRNSEDFLERGGRGKYRPFAALDCCTSAGRGS